MTDSTKSGPDRSKARRSSGRRERSEQEGRDMLDLPLRSEAAEDEEDREEGASRALGPRSPQPRPSPASPPVPPRPARRPAPSSAGRQTRGARRWPLALLLLLVIAALLWWLLPDPARIEVSEASLGFDATRVDRASETRAVTITNIGERALEVRELRFAGGAADHYEVDASDCQARGVAPGASCRLAVTFRPRSRGSLPGALEIVANARNSPYPISLAGTAVSPLVGLAPERLDFGAVPVEGEAATRELTLSNVGELPLELGRIKLQGPHADEFRRLSRCPSTVLDPGEACSFPVTFSPVVAGERSAELAIGNDARGGEVLVELAGLGLWEGPVLSVDPARLDFGEQRLGTRSGARTVRFRNPTPGPINVAAVTLSGDAAFSVKGGTCLGSRLNGGDECRVEVVFSPEQERRSRGEIEVRARESEESLRVELSGSGVKPRLAVESDSLSFGSTRTGLESAARDAVFFNAGTGTLRLGDAGLVGGDPDSFRLRSEGCGRKALGPGKKCIVSVSFRPRDVGPQRAELELAPAEGAAGVRVELDGVGIVAGLALDRSRLDFGDVYRTRHEDLALTLTNAGSATLEIRGMRVIGPGADDYQIASIGCALDRGLSEGRSCVVTLRFAPSVAGKRAAQLVIEHNGRASPAKVGIRGVGLPAVPAFRASTDRFDFGSLPLGRRSSIATLTLSNPGADWMSIQRLTIRGFDPQDFEIVPGTCDGIAALAPGGSCTLGLRFTATETGRRRAELVIEHGARGSPARISLAGAGAA